MKPSRAFFVRLPSRCFFEAIDAAFDRDEPFVLSRRKNHYVRDLL
jgi:hypothetical protein